MKVILLQDIARVGRRFDVTNVPDGHALNFLIPKKMVEPATPQSLKRLEERKGKLDAERTATDEAVAATIEKLEGAPLVIHAEANEQGHLFKGIKADDIAAAARDQGGMLEAGHIQLDVPIKEVGEQEVALVAGDKRATVKVQVVAK